MNTYEITFTRENGTTGTDRFTAANEKQARKDFREVYRHGNGTITSVALVAENVPASKQQEREALDQIRAIVDTLGPDSYLATAFAGCFEDAEANIENDFACSMKDRWLTADRKLNDANGTIEDLREKLAESEKARAADHEITEQKDAEIAALKAKIVSIQHPAEATGISDELPQSTGSSSGAPMSTSTATTPLRSDTTPTGRRLGTRPTCGPRALS